jgi:hypothetical protein
MNDYMEFGIMDYYDPDEETINVFVHTKDNRVLSFKNIKNDPTIYRGLLHIEHEYTDSFILSTQIPVSSFSHLSCYSVKKDKKKLHG